MTMGMISRPRTRSAYVYEVVRENDDIVDGIQIQLDAPARRTTSAQSSKSTYYRRVARTFRTLLLDLRCLDDVQRQIASESVPCKFIRLVGRCKLEERYDASISVTVLRFTRNHVPTIVDFASRSAEREFFVAPTLFSFPCRAGNKRTWESRPRTRVCLTVRF